MLVCVSGVLVCVTSGLLCVSVLVCVKGCQWCVSVLVCVSCVCHFVISIIQNDLKIHHHKNFTLLKVILHLITCKH